MGRLGGEAKRERKVSPGVQNDAKKGPKMRSGGPKSDKKGVRGALGDPEKTGPGKVAEKNASGRPGGAKMEPKFSQNRTKKLAKKRCENNDEFVRFWTIC